MCKFVVFHLLVSLLSIAVVTKCYDFHDSDYNLILSDKLENLEYFLESIDDGDHYRVRRDRGGNGNGNRKCRNNRFKGCCKTDFMENFPSLEKEEKKECYQQVYSKNNHSRAAEHQDPFQCGRVNGRKKDMTCFVQCLAKKKDLVDDEGKLKDAEMRKYVEENLKETWLASHLDDIIPKCLNEAKDVTSENGRDSCNPAAIKSTYCLFREIQLNCPEDQIKDKKACSKFIDKIKTREQQHSTETMDESDEQ